MAEQQRLLPLEDNSPAVSAQVQTIARLTDDGLEQLLVRVERHNKRAQWFNLAGWIVAAPTIFVLAMSIIVFCLLWAFGGSIPTVHFDPSLIALYSTGSGGLGNHGTMSISGITPLALVAMTLTMFRLQRNARRSVARSLVDFEDKRIVGPLIDELRLGEDKGDLNVRNALIRLLPRLEPGDQTLLDSGQRLRMHLYLAYRNTDRNLTLGLLDALGNIGAKEDLPILNRVAAGKGPGNDNSEVRERARPVIERISERLRAEMAPSVLLRAAERPVPEADVLLRAVRGSHSPDTDSLLRPHLTDD